MSANTATTIEQAHAWPRLKPAVDPLDHGWLRADAQRALASHINGDTRAIVEVGSWLGKSAMFMAKSAPDAKVYCIDHWQGSAEHHYNDDFESMLPILFETFCANCWDYRGQIVPIRMSSQDGMREVHRFGVVPDLVYIDASHDYASVLADVALARELFPTAVLVGDDWNSHWLGVTDAVTDYCKAHAPINFEESGKCWIIKP